MAFPTALYSGILIALNGATGPEYFRAGDSLMKPGMICTHDAAADEIKVCISTTKPFGVIGCDADHDLATVYTVGDRVPVWKIGSGVEVWVLCQDDALQTIIKGSIINSSDATTYKGCGMEWTHTAITYTTIVSPELAERNILLTFMVGRAQSSGTITTAIARFVPCLI